LCVDPFFRQRNTEALSLRLDILINNASVGLRGHLPVDAFDRAPQVNLKIPIS